LLRSPCAFSRVDDLRTIVVGADEREATRAQGRCGHEPNTAELAALRRVWLDNEVLYREGLASRSIWGDPAIRERVIFKALSGSTAREAPASRRQSAPQWFTVIAPSTMSAREDSTRQHLRRQPEQGARVRQGTEQRHTGRREGWAAGSRVGPTRTSSRAMGRARQGAGIPFGRVAGLRTRDGWRAMRLNSIASCEAGRLRGRPRGCFTIDRRHRVGAAHQRSARAHQKVR
jgi:hypothetical protein